MHDTAEPATLPARPTYPLTGAAAAAATASFYRDPPFAGGHFGARLGLRPLPAADWLPYAISASEQARKRALFEGPDQRVYRSLGTAASDRDELLALAAIQAARATAPLDAPELWPALMRAAFGVPDDLCLLRRKVPSSTGAAEYEFVAGALCSPSYWRLTDKLGAGLSAIHAPVQDFPESLHERVAQVFDRLPDDRLFERRNWSLHQSDERYQPDPGREFEPVRADRPWFVRSERQVLKRLEPELVLFSIRVDLHPLATVGDHPAALADLKLAVQQLTAAALVEFGGAAKRHAVLEHLEGL